ncbi:low molecular weight protein arginine phosphatase [Tenuibacillus multivorans]|uniref:Protein-tyrosine phosphatase n=1 Tax=Tenuibacillus multivorans TaxID=237069 RepID=A0A1G9X2Q0_9BACI|nr:low molecular weight protein arginine phosphatase [Tenuibacillus multivorans]GEL77261.1 protein-tyrosine-phosphatase [Tenuibacillus multivorans]SDM90726.1 protein-tyrosine phosphatase [Tenuibacillus multivorans]
MKRILFVCTGNTCRSPMAEAMLKHKREDLEVQSAGIMAGHGQAANAKAVEALAEKGIPCDHMSQPITDELVEWADVVLTMTSHHKLNLEMDYPTYKEKVFTLKEYTRQETDEDLNPDIADPIGLSNDTYKQTLEEIEIYINRLIDS